MCNYNNLQCVYCAGIFYQKKKVKKEKEKKEKNGFTDS